jgi:hypothetical protein
MSDASRRKMFPVLDTPLGAELRFGALDGFSFEGDIHADTLANLALWLNGLTIDARMSSPSHDRATPVVYDSECSRMLGVLGAYLHRLQGVSEPTTVRLAGYAQDYARKLSERLADNELAQDRAMAEGGWQPMSSARKDGTPVLLKLKDGISKDRRDLRYWDGVTFVGRHPGVESDGFDLGWQFAAPVGQGGFPDDWFDGWHPMPAPPTPTTKEETL